MFPEDFVKKVMLKIAYINRIVDDWVEFERKSFCDFLKEIYTDKETHQYGLVNRAKVLEKIIIDDGDLHPKRALMIVYLLSKSPTPSYIISYLTVDGDIIEVTDISILTRANFSPEFYKRIQDIVEKHFFK